MSGLPMEVENTDSGCCCNTNSVSKLLTPTSSFDVTGKEGNYKQRNHLGKQVRCLLKITSTIYY